MGAGKFETEGKRGGTVAGLVGGGGGEGGGEGFREREGGNVTRGWWGLWVWGGDGGGGFGPNEHRTKHA